jgi:hypothetical protein
MCHCDDRIKELESRTRILAARREFSREVAAEVTDAIGVERRVGSRGVCEPISDLSDDPNLGVLVIVDQPERETCIGACGETAERSIFANEILGRVAFAKERKQRFAELLVNQRGPTSASPLLLSRWSNSTNSANLSAAGLGFVSLVIARHRTAHTRRLGIMTPRNEKTGTRPAFAMLAQCWLERAD